MNQDGNDGDSAGVQRPLWLYSPGVSELLNMLVDRLDAAEHRGSKAQTVALNERTWPTLYKSPFESRKEDLWENLVEMCRWRWLRVKPDSALRSISGYSQSPRVSVEDEAAVRQAVGRPERVRSAAERWRDAVSRGLQAPDSVKLAVGDYCIEMPDHSMDEVVARLNRIPEFAGRQVQLQLRELSAQLFWGMSKVLDKRQSMVAAILGQDECPFPESPIQLQVHLPSHGFDGVLFVENLTSFDRATRASAVASALVRDGAEHSPFCRLALVYASGFKAGAHRLRSAAGCAVFYSARGGLEQVLRDAFERWLFGGGDVSAPVYFWGDLDYAGMRILQAIRSTFAGASAWRPGYEPMLGALMSGRGHSPEAAEKQGQQSLAATGCDYADRELLPALRATGHFVDQEIFALE